jgi:DNA-directed RNA polymerase specialized sigma24 family protein
VDEPPRRRGRAQRRPLPEAVLPAVQSAAALQRKRARLERQLEVATRERLRTVLELRAVGVTHQEASELLGVTKARVQQLVHEAEAELGVTVAQLREHLAAGGQAPELLGEPGS